MNNQIKNKWVTNIKANPEPSSMSDPVLWLKAANKMDRVTPNKITKGVM